MSPGAKAATLPLLVIEDEPAVMQFIQTALERSHYQLYYRELRRRGAEATGNGKFCRRDLRYAHARGLQRR